MGKPPTAIGTVPVTSTGTTVPGFTPCASPCHPVVDHQFSVAAATDLQRRHTSGRRTMTGQLPVKFHRIDSITATTRQVEQSRIDLQDFAIAQVISLANLHHDRQRDHKQADLADPKTARLLVWRSDMTGFDQPPPPGETGRPGRPPGAIPAHWRSQFIGSLSLLPVAQLKIRVKFRDGGVRDAHCAGDISRAHRPSLTRSPVERGRGLPLCWIAGSFMPIASARSSSFRGSSLSSLRSLSQYAIASRTASSGMRESSARSSGLRDE